MKHFKHFKPVLTLLICAYMAVSCADGTQLRTKVTGKAGEIIVVMEKDDWDAGPGQALRSLLAIDYPFLPQSEPLFTLVSITEGSFSSIFQTHRNLILCDIDSEKKEAKMELQQDIWAAPQIVVRITGPSAESIQKCIEDNSDRLVNAIEQAERNRVIQNAKKYEEVDLRQMITTYLGGSPYFPTGYKLKKKTADFYWIAYETTYTNQGVFIYTYPYRSAEDLSLPRIIAERNLVLEREVPGPLDNTYMTTNTMVEPDLHWIKYNNREFVEVRGLWDVKNDFMGGPFICHCFYDKANERVIVLDGFVYAPKFQKRNYLRQVESILYSFEWTKE